MEAIYVCLCFQHVFLFQAEDGIRDLVRSRGLGDVYKRQAIRIGNPARWRQAAEALDESGGIITAVSDDDILALSLIHI